MEYENIKVKVYYYELDFKFETGHDMSSFFNELTRLSTTRARIRYQYFGDRFIYVQGVENKDKIIKGKIRSIRDDIYPELIDMSDDSVTELEHKVNQGVMETTHFVIDYSRTKIMLALEYNHSGAKIEDFIRYIEKIGISQNILNKIGFLFLTDELFSDFDRRINRVSSFSMKIHKNNLSLVRGMDGDLLSAAHATVNNFENEYALLDFKMDYRKFTDTPKIKKSIMGMLKWFVENPDKKNLFNYLNFTAEDETLGNKLKTYDLLISKEKSEFMVQKKKTSKSIISDDMFPKMLREIEIKKFT